MLDKSTTDEKPVLLCGENSFTSGSVRSMLRPAFGIELLPHRWNVDQAFDIGIDEEGFEEPLREMIHIQGDTLKDCAQRYPDRVAILVFWLLSHQGWSDLTRKGVAMVVLINAMRQHDWMTKDDMSRDRMYNPAIDFFEVHNSTTKLADCIRTNWQPANVPARTST